MRTKPTLAENAMWNILRQEFKKFHFRRQHVLSGFVVDFVSLRQELAIEVDGEIHFNQKARDMERDNIILCKHNIRVIRFLNEEVLFNRSYIIETIGNILQ